MNNHIFLILTVSFLAVLEFSCGSKIKFTEAPVVVKNANDSTPLTCFVDFETSSPFEKVSFLVSDDTREFRLEYAPNEKMEEGYLIFLMRPDTEIKSK